MGQGRWARPGGAQAAAARHLHGCVVAGVDMQRHAAAAPANGCLLRLQGRRSSRSDTGTKVSRRGTASVFLGQQQLGTAGRLALAWRHSAPQSGLPREAACGRCRPCVCWAPPPGLTGKRLRCAAPACSSSETVGEQSARRAPAAASTAQSHPAGRNRQAGSGQHSTEPSPRAAAGRQAGPAWPAGLAAART